MLCHFSSLKMEELLEVSFRVDTSLLAPKEYEKICGIFVWNSTNPGWGQVVPVEESANDLTEIRKTTIRICNTGQLQPDDAIGVQIWVKSPNHDDIRLPTKAGATLIYLEQLYTRRAQYCGQYIKHELVLNTELDAKGRPYKKAVLHVQVKSESISSIEKWKFVPEESLKRMVFKQSNFKQFERVLGHMVYRSQVEFNSDIADAFDFHPNSTSDEHIHAPAYWGEIFPQSTAMFFADLTGVEPDENFMLNLARIALNRENMTEEEFVFNAEQQFSSKEKTISAGMLRCVTLIATMCCILSNSLLYKSDQTYAAHRNGMKASVAKNEDPEGHRLHMN